MEVGCLIEWRKPWLLTVAPTGFHRSRPLNTRLKSISETMGLISIFVSSADTHSERRLDDETTIEQLKVGFMICYAEAF
jgi:hypothetical protein